MKQSIPSIVKSNPLLVILFFIGLSSNAQNTMVVKGNPVITVKYTADPAAMVYKNRVYLYTGHDEAPAGQERYVMNEWLVFTSSK